MVSALQLITIFQISVAAISMVVAVVMLVGLFKVSFYRLQTVSLFFRFCVACENIRFSPAAKSEEKRMFSQARFCEGIARTRALIGEQRGRETRHAVTCVVIFVSPAFRSTD